MGEKNKNTDLGIGLKRACIQLWHLLSVETLRSQHIFNYKNENCNIQLLGFGLELNEMLIVFKTGLKIN